jgi:hypothetical protein
VHFTEHKSFTVQMITMFSLIVLLTLALIFSITAITTPKSAKLNITLPPGVTLVNMYRRRVVHFLKASLLLLSVAAALCLVPGATVRDIAASVLVMGLLLGSIMLPTAYIMARRFDRSATALTLHPGCIGIILPRNGRHGRRFRCSVSSHSRRPLFCNAIGGDCCGCRAPFWEAPCCCRQAAGSNA